MRRLLCHLGRHVYAIRVLNAEQAALVCRHCSAIEGEPWTLLRPDLDRHRAELAASERLKADEQARLFEAREQQIAAMRARTEPRMWRVR